MSKQQLKAATADAPVTSSGSSVASSLNGTLHVKVLRAKNLPRMDFGKRQDPFVLVQLEGSSPKSWATTDPAFQGGTDPEWHAKLNNELELFYDASLHDKDAVLTVEVFSDETGDDLIGTGQVNVGKIAKNQMTNETDFTVKLKDALGGVENRGEVLLTVWWGPPVRKAFRAAQRATKLLDVRDNVVSTLYALVDNALASKYLAGPTAFAKKYRNVSIAAAALLGIAAAGAIGLFVAIAVPTLVVATFTLPFWIIPFVVTAFFTAPLWIPVVLLLCGVGALLATVVFGFGVTSRPVRRQGALLSSRIKHSDMGKRVVYEKHV